MAANIVYWNLRHVRRHEQTLHSSLVYEEHSEKARLEVYWPYDLKWIRGGLGWIEVDWRGGLEVDWPSVLRWIGGGLGWIGVDWPCFHAQLYTQNVGNCEIGEGQNSREQGALILLKEKSRATRVGRVLRILHSRRPFCRIISSDRTGIGRLIPVFA